MSFEDTLQKLRALCRVCLRDPGVVNIFRMPSVLHMLASFVPFQISVDDGLSNRMCNICFKNLKIAFHFRRRCAESQKKFFKILKIHYQQKRLPKFDNKGGTRVNAELENCEVKIEFAEIEIKEEPLDILVSELKQEQDSHVVNLIEKISSNGEINVKPVKPKRKIKFKDKYKTKRLNTKSSSKNIYIKNKAKSETTDLRNTVQEIIPEKVVTKNCFKKELAKNKIQVPNVSVDDRDAGDGSSSKDNNFSCSYCPRIFTDADLFKDHKKLHSQETEECDLCKKVLTGRNKIEIHRKSHEKHPCQICGKLFTKGNLVKHEKKTHGNKVPKPCPICKKILTGIDYYRVHIKAHTRKREFHCDMCKKVFASKMGLKSHMDRHNSVRPYACSYCDMTFVLLKTKKDHECLHTGQRPYGCPLCDKTFIQKSNMKSHFVHNHRHYDYVEVMRKRNAK